MPDDTALDGEVVPLDNDGKPSFSTLQNHGSGGAPLHFFIFDVLILKGKDVMDEALVNRRGLIEEHVLPKLVDLRHGRFMGLREDKKARDVKRRLNQRWVGAAARSRKAAFAEDQSAEPRMPVR